MPFHPGESSISFEPVHLRPVVLLQTWPLVCCLKVSPFCGEGRENSVGSIFQFLVCSMPTSPSPPFFF